MKLNELLALDSEGWEKISDEDLKKFLDPYLKVTRPTKIPEKNTKSPSSSKKPSSSAILSSNQDMIKQLAGLLKQTELLK